VPAMSNGNPAYETITLVALIERIGIDLRERYRPTEELPASLFTLVRKLDAVERQSVVAPNAASACGTRMAR
jgi:hypothetical protein